MKVTITDKEALAALSWEALKAYMDASSWKRADTIADKAAVYQHTDATGRLWEILVPLRRDLGDYVSRMADAVTILARIEDRSELDVYDDLRALGTQSPMIDDATRTVHEKIRRWLAEEGWRVQDMPNPNSILSLVLTLPDGSLRLFQARKHVNHIVVARHLALDGSVQSELSEIPSDELHEVIWNIRRDATLVGVDIEGLEPPLHEIWHLTPMYFDGLTKDVLIQRILLVMRATSLTRHTLVRGLEQAERPAAAAALRRLAPDTKTSSLISAAS